MHERVTDQRLVAPGHGRDAPESLLPRYPADRDRSQVPRRAQRQHRPDVQTLVGAVQEAPGSGRRALQITERRDQLRVARRVDDLLQRHVVGRQPRRIDLHLDLPVPLAEDRDIGHAGHPQEARLDDPAREVGQLERVQGPRAEPDQHHPAARGQRLDQQRWLGDVGKRERVGQPLLHQLASVQQRRAGLEVQVDRRHPGDRVRADVPDAHDPVEEVVLERNRDVLLDFLAGEPQGLGLDIQHRSGGEFRNGIGVHRPSEMTPRTITPAASPTSSIRNRSDAARTDLTMPSPLLLPTRRRAPSAPQLKSYSLTSAPRRPNVIFSLRAHLGYRYGCRKCKRNSSGHRLGPRDSPECCWSRTM